jgi:hypothetical protein
MSTQITTSGKTGSRPANAKKRGMNMFKKLFAAAICGAVIASISTHADAAGPGGFARGFAKVEHEVVTSVAPMTSADTIDISRQQALSALDQYFKGFDQSRDAR